MTQPTFGISTHILAGLKPEEHFRIFAHYGLSLVELNLNYFPLLEDPEKFRELQQLITRSGIRVNSFHFPYGSTVPALENMDISHPDPDVRKDTINAVHLCLDRLVTLNAQSLVIHPSVGQINDIERKDRLALCPESLRACVKILDKAQSRSRNGPPLKIAVETLPPTGMMNNVHEISGLFHQLDNPSIGLCLDVNHINLAGQDPVAFTRQVGSRVITTHLSDNDGIKERHWLPGRGVIPWKEWLSALVSTGYTGPLLYETSQVEGSSDEETIAEICRSAVELSTMIP